jgi:RNA polymerase sigma factor (sigma-70 family)
MSTGMDHNTPVETPPAGETHLDRQALLQAAPRLVRPLYSFVRRRLGYLEDLGVLSAGTVRAEEIVDAAFLRALERLPERPPQLSLLRWLRRLATREIERVARESRRQERMERSLFAPLAVPATGEEMPEVPVRLIDILPDPTVLPPPEELERQEFQRYLNRTLAQLPETWREAFLLHRVDGYSIEEVAALEGEPVEEIRRMIASAQEFLRARLREALEAGAEAGTSRASQEVSHALP